jgi:hypothetical protein
MRRTDLVVSLTLIAAGTFVIAWVIPTCIPARSMASIQPSVFPTVSMALVVLLSVVLLAQALMRPSDPDAPVMAPQALARFAGYSIGLAASWTVITFAGFYVGGIATIVGFMLIMGERRVMLVAAVSVGVTITLGVALEYVLSISLP